MSKKTKAEQERLETEHVDRIISKYGYSIVAAQCDNRFFKFTIKRARV